MASSLSQVMCEARQLLTKLHDREKLADDLVARGNSLNERINCMKEYQEDVVELRNASEVKPRSNLVQSLQRENRQIRQLQDDNRQLKLALEEHQGALDMIMQRHRQVVRKMASLQKLQNLAEKQVQLTEQSYASHSVHAAAVTASDDGGQLILRQQKFAQLFEQCLRTGEQSANADYEDIVRLKTENSVLRQLLQIASSNDAQLVPAFLSAVGASTSSRQPAVSASNVDEEENSDGLENGEKTPTEETSGSPFATSPTTPSPTPPVDEAASPSVNDEAPVSAAERPTNVPGVSSTTAATTATAASSSVVENSVVTDGAKPRVWEYNGPITKVSINHSSPPSSTEHAASTSTRPHSSVPNTQTSGRPPPTATNRPTSMVKSTSPSTAGSTTNGTSITSKPRSISHASALSTAASAVVKVSSPPPKVNGNNNRIESSPVDKNANGGSASGRSVMKRASSFGVTTASTTIVNGGGAKPATSTKRHSVSATIKAPFTRKKSTDGATKSEAAAVKKANPSPPAVINGPAATKGTTVTAALKT